MSEFRSLLDRKAARLDPDPSGWDRMQRLARRRQRNRRIGAAIVAVAVFIGVASGLWAALHPDPPISRPGAPSLHLISAARVSLVRPVTNIANYSDASC